MKKLLSIVLAAVMLGSFAACAPQTSSEANNRESSQTSSQTSEKETEPIVTKLPKIDMSKWHYDEDRDIYYQLEIEYCETPADEKLENLSVFVPGKYMNATKNSDGSFTCELNDGAAINTCSATTAPIVMPINTEGYFSAEPLTAEIVESYPGVLEEVDLYTSQGFVYILPGCRGIKEGAPTGVTDLKAAIRYVRYCDDVIAGDAESIFVFGMSGGGAQAAILGAAGDSELYDPYLKTIGAVEGVSDAVAGSMDWCPITDIDTADAEYEWMMGCTRPERSAEEQAISDNLAKAFVDYLNNAGFTDKDGNVLTLTESKEGIYQAGSYYEYIKSVIEQSLNNYLTDTDFANPELHNSYGSAENYIASLNKDGKWIDYDTNSKKATIHSIADFVKHCKNALPMVVGFDQPSGGNTLFGYGDGKGSHFDKILANILTELGSEYATAYNADLAKKDSFGYTVEQRVNMYTPLYYLMPNREGFGKSTVAKYWRIRSGIEQKNTSLTTEVNLSLALEQYDGVESVDFETVWAKGHEQVERSGDCAENFIEWIKACSKG